MVETGTSSKPRLSFALLATAIYLANYLAIQRTPELGLAPLVDWPVAVDLLLLVPLLYLWFNRPVGFEHLVKATALASLGILLGSWMLPADSKAVWLVLEPARFLALGMVLIFQFGLICLIARDIWFPSRPRPPEENLHAALEHWLAPGLALELMKLEGRMWLYALSGRARKQKFEGDCFFGRSQSGNESNQLGFLILVAAEIPVMHVLLGLVHPTLALVVSILTLYGWVFLYAEFRATQSRPISLLDDHLRIRYGLVGDLSIAYELIVDALPCVQRPERQSTRLRFVGMGEANVVIRLKAGTRLMTLLGPRLIDEVYLGLDEPGKFLEWIDSRRAKHIQAGTSTIGTGPNRGCGR